MKYYIDKGTATILTEDQLNVELSNGQDYMKARCGNPFETLAEAEEKIREINIRWSEAEYTKRTKTKSHECEHGNLVMSTLNPGVGGWVNDYPDCCMQPGDILRFATPKGM